MVAGKKIRVAVLYGGRSGEHEISLISAASVIRNLDPNLFEVVPIGIDKDGKWHLNSLQLIEKFSQERSLPIFKDQPEVVLPPRPQGSGGGALIPISGSGASQSIDVVFPVMHGPLCEDGTIQGFLELANLPYVGAGVLASSVGMDKDVAKRLARDSGLPVVPFVTVRDHQWKKDLSTIQKKVSQELGFPCFVKPSNMGSSVGVHKVKSPAELAPALRDAFQYDTKVLIEKAIAAREVEIAVLENDKYGEAPMASVPGEIAPTHEFYSYEAKYLDENGAALLIPAKLSPEQTKQVQKIAQDIFLALECEGMARVDLFVDKTTSEIYFNEVNTIPGFTHISMYPKMWEASGIPYGELITRLIRLAIARHERKQALSREFKQEN